MKKAFAPILTATVLLALLATPLAAYEQKTTFQEEPIALQEVDETKEDQEFSETPALEEEEVAVDERPLPPEPAVEKQEHVVIDSRPLSPEKRKLMKLLREEEMKNSEEVATEEASYLSVLQIPIGNPFINLVASDELNVTASSVSPALYHWIESFPQDTIVKMEDGTEWIFDQNDVHLVRSWRPGDTIVISPKGNWGWGSNFSYVLTNKDLGSSVSVNPFLGPVAFGPYSTWVVAVNKDLSQVYLLDGQGNRSVWEVASNDSEFASEWSVNDAVIVGENTSWLWWFSSYNHILINVNMNHNIRARQISATPHYR